MGTDAGGARKDSPPGPVRPRPSPSPPANPGGIDCVIRGGDDRQVALRVARWSGRDGLCKEGQPRRGSPAMGLDTAPRHTRASAVRRTTGNTVSLAKLIDLSKLISPVISLSMPARTGTRPRALESQHLAVPEPRGGLVGAREPAKDETSGPGDRAGGAPPARDGAGSPSAATFTLSVSPNFGSGSRGVLSNPQLPTGRRVPVPTPRVPPGPHRSIGPLQEAPSQNQYFVIRGCSSLPTKNGPKKKKTARFGRAEVS